MTRSKSELIPLFFSFLLHGLSVLCLLVFSGFKSPAARSGGENKILVNVISSAETKRTILSKKNKLKCNCDPSKPNKSEKILKTTDLSTSGQNLEKDKSPDIGSGAVDLTKNLNDPYLEKIFLLINNNKKYPRLSKLNKEFGTVIVSFVVKNDGKISDIKIIKSSGYKRLDDSAMQSIIELNSVDNIPEYFHKEKLTLDLPINYILSNY